MNTNELAQDTARELARAAVIWQQERTGVAPKAATAILSDDMLVLTFNDALTLAERDVARTPEGAAQVQHFHRQLFSSSSKSMKQEIKRITGREVREAFAELETASGAVVHAFTNGAMVQVFLLTPEPSSRKGMDRDSMERADNDGFHA